MSKTLSDRLDFYLSGPTVHHISIYVCHDIAEILWKAVLNTITLTLKAVTIKRNMIDSVIAI
jgi:hypothetical protein